MSNTIVIDKDSKFRIGGGSVNLPQASAILKGIAAEKSAISFDQFEASLSSMIDLDGVPLGVPLEVIGKAIATMANLLAAHWNAIRKLADDEDAEGTVKVAFGIELDFSDARPVGKVTITYSKKFKDEASFRLDDPKQPKLPLEGKAE